MYLRTRGTISLHSDSHVESGCFGDWNPFAIGHMSKLQFPPKAPGVVPMARELDASGSI